MRYAVLALCPTLLLGQAQAPPQQKASLEGSAVNSATGEPVRKAHVTLRLNLASGLEKQPPPNLATTTDNTGRFQFLDLEPGDYQLHIRRDGYQDGQAGVHTGRKVVDPIVLAPGDHRTGLAVKMTPFGALTGRVVDEDGDPIQDMQVAAMTYRYTTRGRELVESRPTRTDDQGEYRIYNLAPAKYFLKVSSDRLAVRQKPEEIDTYVPVYYPGAPDTAGAQPIELAAGQQLRNLNFALRRSRYATLRGRVVGPPDAHLRIGLMVVTENGSSSTGTSLEDKDGKFSLYGVAPGPVVVIGGYDTLRAGSVEMRLPLEVGTEDINNLELRPLPPMEVPGRVVIDGAAQEKVTDLGFRLRGRNATDSSTSPSNDGALAFHNVPQDSYRLESTGLHSDQYVKSVRWGVTDVTDGEIDLNAGLPPDTSLSIVVGTDAGALEGTVTDDQSAAVEDAQVVMVPRSHHSRPYYKSASTDASGHFAIHGIAPGEYQVIAFDRVNINAIVYDPDFLKPFQTSGKSLSVSPKDKQQLELKVILNTQK